MRRTVQAILEAAGVEINGSSPWDIVVHDERLWRRVLLHGTIGLGEAYMDGWWDCRAIDELVHRVLMVARTSERHPWWKSVSGSLLSRIYNFQSLARAFQVGEHHYDIGNDLYRAMLGEDLVYSCAYWQGGATSLAEAQRDKLELTCRKLGLQPGMRILDIGCGWGSFARYAAEHFSVQVVGLTVSKEQLQFARDNLSHLPVEVLLKDYRDYEGRFDAVVSIGMFEHVGWRNYRTYMNRVRDFLKPDGLFLLHTIGANRTSHPGETWHTRYIFPNGYIPSIKQIAKAVEQRFVVEDLHNFGPDYALTLMEWHTNFERAWPHLKGTKPAYTEHFHRMWRFYLLSCAGAFRARDQQLWQWVLSPKGQSASYVRPVLNKQPG
ncbi:MAG: cyclopropane fatty acyl phospholipid synthase [Puniceicoccaceae bacterium]